MQILDYVRDFLHDGSRLPFREEFLPEDFVQQLAASHQLEHEVDLVLLLEHVPQADYVRVLAVPEEDLNLLLAVSLTPVKTSFCFQFTGVLFWLRPSSGAQGALMSVCLSARPLVTCCLEPSILHLSL